MVKIEISEVNGSIKVVALDYGAKQIEKQICSVLMNKADSKLSEFVDRRTLQQYTLTTLDDHDYSAK